MRKLLFTGVVRPERAQLTIGNVAHQLDLASGTTCQVKFNVFNNQLSALVEAEESEDIYTLRNIVKGTIELVTDIVGFVRGYAYDVEIVKVINEDLELSHVFGIQIPALEERNKRTEPEAVNHIYPLCLGVDGKYLKRALSDLGMAIRHADDTPFYCFRAIESLKQYFGYVTGKTEDKEQWQEMTRAIGDHRTTVEPIRKLAFPARHGLPDATTDDERKNLFFSAWEIVEAFINFRLKETGSNYVFQPAGLASGPASG